MSLVSRARDTDTRLCHVTEKHSRRRHVPVKKTRVCVCDRGKALTSVPEMAVLRARYGHEPHPPWRSPQFSPRRRSTEPLEVVRWDRTRAVNITNQATKGNSSELYFQKVHRTLTVNKQGVMVFKFPSTTLTREFSVDTRSTRSTRIDTSVRDTSGVGNAGPPFTAIHRPKDGERVRSDAKEDRRREGRRAV